MINWEESGRSSRYDVKRKAPIEVTMPPTESRSAGPGGQTGRPHPQLTSEPSAEDQVHEQLNLLITLIGHHRQDVALAVGEEALALCEEADLPGRQFVVLVTLCRMLDPVHFPADYTGYLESLTELAVTRADTIIAEAEEFSHFAPVIDSLLGQAPDSARSRLTQRFSAVRSLYDKGLDQIIDKPPADVGWPPEMADFYATISQVARGDSHSASGAPLDLRAAHNVLCQAITAAKLSAGERRMVLADVHRTVAVAGIRLGQLTATLAASRALIDEPAQLSVYRDRIQAAQTILWALRNVLDDEQLRSVVLYRSRLIRGVRDVVWETLNAVYPQRIARFVAINLVEMSPLVAEYVDYLALRGHTRRQAMSVITKFQGALLGAAHEFGRDPDQRSAEFDFFAYELDSLLRYQSLTGLGSDSDAEPANAPLLLPRRARAVTSPSPSPAAVLRRDAQPSDSGYQSLSFRISEVDEVTPAPIDVWHAQKNLAADEALIVLFASDRWLYGATVQASRRIQLRKLADIGRVRSTSRDLVEVMRADDGRFLLNGDDFSWLSELVVGELASELSEDITQLTFIAPQLTLPLHLAYFPQTGRYLIDDYVVAYSHSVHMYRRRLASPRTGPRTALLIGSSTSAGRTLTHVPEELSAIAGMLRPYYDVSGPYHHRNSVLSSLTKVSVIHYAGHMSGAGEPDQWQLQLAAGPIGPSELLSRVDEGTEMVSLFACFSADQQSRAPEPLGLSALLAAAGVRSFVGCLWAIPDRVAAAIAADMYRGWVIDGMPIPAAMRSAVLKWRRWSPLVWGSVVSYRMGNDISWPS